MIRDYAAYQLTAHRSDIQALVKAEADYGAARKAGDKNVRRKAEERLGCLRQKFASEIPAVAFHYFEATKAAKSDEIRAAWQEKIRANPDEPWQILSRNWQLDGLAEWLERPSLAITDLPLLAFWLRFHFLLDKPFISRDEEIFYVIDNPIRKDKVLRLPYISPSSYKGALRSAARYTLGVPQGNPDSEILERLFGTDKRKRSKELRQGRLWFFPTFFRQLGIEVINPHRRDTGAGTVPIPFEAARGGGYFQLLYFPFDLAPDDLNEAADDIEAVAKAVEGMFLTYGLSAKKTSGYGIAQSKATDFSWVVHYRPVQADSKDHQAAADLLRHEAAEFDLNDLPRVAVQMAETLRRKART